ncbi:hypothetical protein C8J56DRAFT_1046892 [Mycena floridula]|nr:hypothetical protein C8J56DRAFT_1046892 [Mycena floridula]
MHISFQILATLNFLASTLAWPIPVSIFPRGGATVQSMSDMAQTSTPEALQHCNHLLTSKQWDHLPEPQKSNQQKEAIVKCLIDYEIAHRPAKSTSASEPKGSRVVTLDSPIVPLTKEQMRQEMADYRQKKEEAAAKSKSLKRKKPTDDSTAGPSGKRPRKDKS